MARLKVWTDWRPHVRAQFPKETSHKDTYPCAVYSENGGGYESVEQLQRELIRRFPQDKPVRIDRGIEMLCEISRYQRVTLED